MRVRLDSIGSQESELIEFTVFANNELIMKRSPPLRWLALFPASAVIIVVGCGYDNGLKLAHVSGKVTYKGEPVKNGTVFFMPDEGKGTLGPSATGSLRDDGTYIASTDFAGDGVIVAHRVGLTALQPVTAGTATGPGAETDPSGLPPRRRRQRPPGRPGSSRWAISSPTRAAGSTATCSPGS